MDTTISSRRSIAATLLILAMTAALLLVAPAAAEAATRSARPTVQSYRAQLTAAAATDAGAAETLAEFSRLGARDQVRFVRYLADEQSLATLVDVASDDTLSAASLHAGDVATTSDTEVVLEEAAAGEVGIAALRAGTYRSTYTVSQKILGITVTKLSVWVRYETNGSRITRVLNSGSGVSNYNFVVSISQSNSAPWLSGGRAWAETVWQGSLIYKGFGIRLDKRQTMSADNNGTVRGSLVNI